MQLIFNQTAIPRTTTRDQWRVIHRWRRKTARFLVGKACIERDVLSTLPDVRAIRKAICFVRDTVAA